MFALVEGDDKDERIANAVQWMMYWLRFKSLCNQTGCVVFDIDDTLVDNKGKTDSFDDKIVQTLYFFRFYSKYCDGKTKAPKIEKKLPKCWMTEELRIMKHYT